MKKKSLFVCAGLCAAMVLASCGTSKESAYKKAYETAKAQEQVVEQQPVAQAPVVAPVVEQPVNQAPVVDNVDNVSVRSENVTLIDGAGLQNFSVVVGSFSVKANAQGLQGTLKAAGYPAQIVLNSGNNMYRVVATTHADKASAVQSRNQFRAGNYPDAWLLFKK